MSKVSWKSKDSIDAEQQEIATIEAEKEKYSQANFLELTSNEKDELLYMLCKEHGYI